MNARNRTNNRLDYDSEDGDGPRPTSNGSERVRNATAKNET